MDMETTIIFLMLGLPWWGVCGVLALCLVGWVAFKLGASFVTTCMVAGMFCVPVGWVIDRLFRKLIGLVERSMKL